MTDFGHVSIEVDGTVYSLGRYGETWGLFKSKGEAVLLKINRKTYLSPAELRSYLNIRYNVEKNNEKQLETQYSRTPEKLERKIIKEVVTHKKKK